MCSAGLLALGLPEGQLHCPPAARPAAVRKHLRHFAGAETGPETSPTRQVTGAGGGCVSVKGVSQQVGVRGAGRGQGRADTDSQVLV